MKALKTKNSAIDILLGSTSLSEKRALKKTDEIKLYVCGITPYDFSHVGHGRCYVTFDLLYRVLLFLGYPVKYIRNFTDIDDKLIKKAGESIENIKKVSSEFIGHYHDDMARLALLKPDKEPRVTDEIESIINFIAGLLDKKYAYQLGFDIYFDTEKFKKYGELSGKSLDDLLAGARIDINQGKKHPSDFALWKGNNQEKYWQAPWGWGRPGWHIECSAFIKKFLGDSITIHGGGQDLIFPHHENEKAQSEALTEKKLSEFWVHNAHVTLDKEKMSKSLGNYFTLRDIFKEIDPMVVKFYLLQHHYKTPLDFSLESVKQAINPYKKLCALVSGLDNTGEIYTHISSQEHVKSGARAIQDQLVQDILSACADDLNSPKAIGLVFANYKYFLENITARREIVLLLRSLCGLTLIEPDNSSVEPEVTPEIKQLIEERNQARLNKNWAEADRLRDKLKELGFNVQDKKI